MQSPLDLWQPGRGVGSSSRVLDPKCCPVMTSDHDSRWPTWKQCVRKPREDRVRPVRGLRGLDQRTETDMAVCGQHASVYDKRLEKLEARATERRVDDARHATATAACERLKAEFGIDAKTEYVHAFGGSRLGGYSGKVVVNPADLFRFLNAVNDRLEGKSHDEV